MTLTVKVISPDRTLVDASAEEVILPSITGQLGILTNHAPLITALDIGVMRFRQEKAWTAVALMGGFAEVESNEVTILVNAAEAGSDINAEVARNELAAAEERLKNIKEDDKQGKIQADQEMRRARARLQATATF
ncbi:ATP synthase F1 subunit epsilon [Pseudanabaena sp. PCC 6802]|uniref:ATP synthase F1 subunit epsilon n=1 Tax=Pseudanabaena sp. PCC 6802 TaxID=118173 RepID=UPI000346F971|nr:ATP synthase F1 subunit epsilon [Pseudanabaena sp. PCC 6802]